MKNFITASLILSTMILVSCNSAKKTTTVKIPEIKKYEPTVITKPGFKCDIIGEIENKEVFLQVINKEGKTTVSFHDFTSATKVSMFSAKFEGFTLMSFSTAKNSEETATLIVEGPLMHSNPTSLSDEGKVLTVNGKLTLNENMSGSLEQELLIFEEDLSTRTTAKELAKIENCEEFEAVWL